MRLKKKKKKNWTSSSIQGTRWLVWYVCLNNSFQFFLEIRVGEKICENTCNIV